MYHNLIIAIKKSNIRIINLADNIGVTEKTLRNKLNGITEFTWPEVLRIRSIVAPETSLEELFDKNTNANICS